MKGFSSPKRSLGGLDAETAATLIAAASDMALVADSAGVIRDLAIQNEDLAAELEQPIAWTGRKWIDTVTPDSRPKIEALLAQAASPEGVQRWRHVNFPSAGGSDVPILFSAIRLAKDGRIIGFGRDLRAVSTLQQRLVEAQQSMERDYARRQQMETRYRILFQMSPEAVLIIDASTLRINEANPAALQLLGDTARRVTGRGLVDFLDHESARAFQNMLSVARSTGRAADLRARLASREETNVTVHLFRQDDDQLALVRMSVARARDASDNGTESQLLRLIETLPDAFVVTTSDGEIISANPSFLAMAQLVSEDQARGESLDRWLGRPGVDLNVLIMNLRQRSTVRLFATVFRDEYGASTEVEISAAAVNQGDQSFLGFSIRNVAARLTPAASSTAVGRALPRPVEQLTELIGRVALKDLVREATDMIERLCIEAALEMTGDNRASAADLLGLSRQSLYVKLRRYGLSDSGEADA